MKITTKDKQLLKYVQSLFDKPIYLVGGAVRDMVMGNQPKDYDFCSEMTPDEVEKQLKGIHRSFAIGKKHGTIGFKVGTDLIEITTFRTEVYKENCRKPNVEFVKSLSEDLSRRDLTINSMALRCDNFKLIDPFGGKDDIKSKVIRTVGDSKLRFNEDPLRILRAIGFATKYSFEFEDKTARRIEKMGYKLLTISKERIVDELDKILLLKTVGYGLYLMWKHRIFAYTIPELQVQHLFKQNSPHHSYDLDVHTTKVVSFVPAIINLRWAALLHDIAKPVVITKHKKGHYNYINHELVGAEMVERLGRSLKWSNERRETVVELVLTHLKEDSILKKYDNAAK